MSYWASLAAMAEEQGVEWAQLSAREKDFLLSEYVREHGWRVTLEGISNGQDLKLTEVFADMIEVRNFKPDEFLEACRTAIATLYAIMRTEAETIVQMQYDNEVPDPETEAFMISMNRGRI